MPLPIDEVIPKLKQSLLENHQLVLEAPPGAGKTTVVPLRILGEPWQSGKIIMLEPRRMAARAVAHRMASLLGEKVGNTVGYRIRQEQCISENTQIEVVTGGVLLNILQQDPTIEDYCCVILDEFHERNLDSDFALSLCLQTRHLFRDDDHPLKLIVMSATLDGQRLAEYLNAPRIVSEGRSYPVRLIYQGEPNAAQFQQQLISTIVMAHQQHSGDILVFLPGQKDIRQAQRALVTQLPERTSILPLYGNLPLAAQLAAIEPVKGDKFDRKIVLATDIAETSLTIEGVTVVVDSCLHNKAIFDPNSGLTRLKTLKISRACATQRMGRAGRICEGVCYRLIAPSTTLTEYSPPEIKQADLSNLVLQMFVYGINDPNDMDWVDSPTTVAMDSALTLLEGLGAIEKQGSGFKLTKHGEALSQLNTHPRLAHMILSSHELGLISQACFLAACLMEPGRPPDWGHDVEQWIDKFEQGVTTQSVPKGTWLSRVKKQMNTFVQLVKPRKSEPDVKSIDSCAGVLIALAYPDRIAKKRHDSDHQYLLSSGRAARTQLHWGQAQWLACAEVGGQQGAKEDRIYLAAALSETDINRYLSANIVRTEKTYWDTAEKRLKTTMVESLGAITVSEKNKSKPHPEVAVAALLSYLKNSNGHFLTWNDTAVQLRCRVELLRQSDKQCRSDLPNFSQDHLLDHIEDWLAPYLPAVRTEADLQKLPIDQILADRLGWQKQRLLDELAPTHITAPSGFQVAIDYRHSPPVLKIKLQEMFGCTETPTINRGTIPLMLHLLSPAGRPLQVTQDLIGFWRNSYHEVKKEMKGRYPKHPWPDNPETAAATRWTKRKPNAQL